MTERQQKWYWREWAAVKRACEAAYHPVPDRHDLHRQALGEDKSSKEFTNDDLDDVIAEFKAYSEPANLQEQLRLQNGRRLRRIYRIKKLAPEAYWLAIAKDKFGHGRLHDLDLDQLTQLRNTLCARNASFRGGKEPSECN